MGIIVALVMNTGMDSVKIDGEVLIWLEWVPGLWKGNMLMKILTEF